PLAKLLNGTYSGLYSPAFNQDLFLGIPYAQDTSGANRFRIPQPLNTTWPDTRPATQYGHACPDGTPEDDALHGMSENCLSINIVRPRLTSTTDTNPLLPILFWIHGGAYQVGTSALPRYNLSYLVARSAAIGRPVLGASINYRKGGWGLLHSLDLLGTGNTNLALRDMRLALAWVQENIAAFGGDPRRVTIWGESAGSFAVGQLLLAHGGRDGGRLFHGSIQESGSATTAWYNGTERYQPIYEYIVHQVGCGEAADTLECLRAVPYEELYPHVHAAPGAVDGGPGYYPIVDGDVIPNYPSEMLREGRFARVPHLYGTNSDEGTDNAPAGDSNSGRIDTDDDLYQFLLHGAGFNFPPSTVRRIMELYPDDPALGIPLGTGDERFAEKGWQYKRVAAIVGDVFYHAPRLDDARRYAQHGDDTYVYRFNERAWLSAVNTPGGVVNATCVEELCGALAPAWEGVAHATELAFVFGNAEWLGPWEGYRRLSERMMDMWVHFAHDGNPNGPGEVVWPQYASGGEEGVNLVLQTEEKGGLYVERDVYRREGREYLSKWARRRRV
ncbi:Alpha/Beta hydrolase protein, partial [Bombardia bombarda]